VPEQAAGEETETEAEAEPAHAPDQPKRSGSRRAAVRAEAQAKGLRVIKGGKDPATSSDSDDEGNS
jgi:hypothetical protein